MRSTSVSLPRKRPSLLTRIFRFCRRCFTGLVILVLLGLGYKQLEAFLHPPQAVLVLGGSVEREKFAAAFAQAHPNLPVWISSGSNPEYAEWVFQEAGIAPDRLHLDYRAVDTVTNFTTLVDQFKQQGIDSLYLITSDYHMRRASVIGEIVLGSRGIDFETVEVPSQRSPEPLDKAIRDGARAVLWVTTGSTGSSFADVLSQK
jgi:uncharacterized SAM-binding protein YcdF (DUF218 family)